MRTRPGPVREKMVSADYLFSVFDNEGFIVRSLPIGEGSGFAHVGREWISLTGTYRRLHNAPYRVLIIGTGTSQDHAAQFRCLHHQFVSSVEPLSSLRSLTRLAQPPQCSS